MAARRPIRKWPGGARVAVSFVINFEEGAEMSLSSGDPHNEKVYEVTDEVVGVPDRCMESHFEYGTKAAWWRIADALERLGVVTTVSTCGMAAAAVAVADRGRGEARPRDRLPWLALGEARAHGGGGRARGDRQDGEGADRDRRHASRRLAHALDALAQHAPPAGRGGRLSLRQRRLLRRPAVRDRGVGQEAPGASPTASTPTTCTITRASTAS